MKLDDTEDYSKMKLVRTYVRYSYVVRVYILKCVISFIFSSEYWENAKIRYMCNDTSLGIDGSGSSYHDYMCVPDEEIGRYNTPRESHNETWPVCQDRTTTVKARELK